MTRLGSVFLAALLCHAPGRTVVADESRVGDTSHWFYMVKSRPVDPAREAEYNRWYDDIDIPDVLAVPGFMRARRGIARDISDDPTPDERTYVALYDITTNDIDRTIIDLYVAARKMAALDRLTDALNVIEANYYRRLGEPHDVRGGATVVGERYLYVRKILCCREPRVREAFLNWYHGSFISGLGESGSLKRVILYELYRVMEVLAVPPDEVPHLLIVFELSAPTATRALASLDQAIASLRTERRLHDAYVEGPATLYQQMSDVVPK
jgi:hypothetical protein